MRKLLPVIIVIILLFLSLISHGQQPVIEIKSFEYSWSGRNDAMNVIVALDDSSKKRIESSFAKAFKNRWNVALPAVSFSFKPLSAFSNQPRFKTQLKEKEPGKWYLFLQVFENANIPNTVLEDDAISTSLELRCKLVNGANDSVITDKTLTVNIIRRAPPKDQVPLRRLPACPDSFVQGFDSIATWLFEPEQVSKKSLKFKSACVFQEVLYSDTIRTRLAFKRNIMGIHQLTLPTFTLQPSSPLYVKTGMKRNVGGRSLGGVVTALTGLSTGKTKYYKYKADCSFKDNDSTWHCLIDYTEEVSAERIRVKEYDGSHSLQSSDYQLSARYTDPHSLNVITLEADTLATFRMTNINDVATLTSYDKLWDGSDSTTIAHLLPKWNNKVAEKEVVLSGKIGNDTFTMKTCKGKRIKEFYINDRLVTTINGRPGPISGLVFHPVSVRQLKIFTILSSLPYAYLCEFN